MIVAGSRKVLRNALHMSTEVPGSRSNPLALLSRHGPSVCSACSPIPQLHPRLTRTFSSGSSQNLQSSAPRSSQQNPPTKISYAISASYSAKHHRLSSLNLYSHDPFQRLKPPSPNGRREKRNRPKSGEDAFFVSPINNSSSTAFGVVDGVGGWANSGVDPADFAHGLCEHMTHGCTTWPDWEDLEDDEKTRTLASRDVEGPDPLRPVELLELGYQRVLNDKSINAGGSTACIAIGDIHGAVQIANLGDSGALHLSPHRISAFTSPQTHAFNTPYQLTKLPPRMLVQHALFGGKPYSELPSHADVSLHQLAHGDVLVLATDGVWDNLSAQDALKIVSREMETIGGWLLDDEGGGTGANMKLAELTSKGRAGEDTLQSRLALAVVRAAKEASLSRTRDGPFAREVQRLYPEENWKGGKADDICVVVAVAVKDGLFRSKL